MPGTTLGDKKPGVLVLFSAGMDSTVALLWAIHNHDGPVHAVTFDYAQRHRREIQQAIKIWKLVSDKFPGRVGHHHVVPLYLAPFGALSGMESVKQYDRSPSDEEAHSDPAFMPYRNLIFLSQAALWARVYDCHTIVTGLRGGFPDCTDKFENLFAGLAMVADPSWKLTVTSPVHNARSTAIDLATRLPWAMAALGMSHTCFMGNERPCGKCLPCIRRAEGFALAGIPDPIFFCEEQ